MPDFLLDYFDWLKFMIPYWSDEWRSAFLFTQAVEIPIYMVAMAYFAKKVEQKTTNTELSVQNRVLSSENASAKKSIGYWFKLFLIAFGASAITHPFVWFFFPYFLFDRGADYYWYVIVPLAEAFAVLTEALYFYRWKLPMALGWTLLANGASFGLGLLWR